MGELGMGSGVEFRRRAVSGSWALHWAHCTMIWLRAHKLLFLFE